MKAIDTRLTALEKAADATKDHPSQVVIYNPVTGEPLNTPDPKAARQIWIPDNGLGLQRISR